MRVPYLVSSTVWSIKYLLALKIHSVIFDGGCRQMSGPGREIAGGEARQTWGLLQSTVGSGKESQGYGQWSVLWQGV